MPSQYETSVTIDGQGGIHLAGLPFTPGTEVQILVTPMGGIGSGRDGVAALITALDRAHNTEPVGALRREELYDRNDVH